MDRRPKFDLVWYNSSTNQYPGGYGGGSSGGNQQGGQGGQGGMEGELEQKGLSAAEGFAKSKGF